MQACNFISHYPSPQRSLAYLVKLALDHTTYYHGVTFYRCIETHKGGTWCTIVKRISMVIHFLIFFVCFCSWYFRRVWSMSISNQDKGFTLRLGHSWILVWVLHQILSRWAQFKGSYFMRQGKIMVAGLNQVYIIFSSKNQSHLLFCCRRKKKSRLAENFFLILLSAYKRLQVLCQVSFSSVSSHACENTVMNSLVNWKRSAASVYGEGCRSWCD